MSDLATTSAAPVSVPGTANGHKGKQRAMPTRKEKQDITIMEVRLPSSSYKILY